MAATPRALTADDMLEMPVPDGLLGYEFVDGEPVPVTPASRIQGSLHAAVGHALMEHVKRAGLDGEVFTDAGFVLGLARDSQRMRAPDVSYVERSKLDANPDRERLMRGAPDLAVEIDLASGKKPHGQQRILDYLEAGVRLVWAIDPRTRTATVYRPDGSARLVRAGEALDGEEVVPGFRLELSELFHPSEGA